MEDFYAKITRSTEPTTMKGQPPKRWAPELAFSVKCKEAERQLIYDVTLEGFIGQNDPSWLERAVDALSSRLIGGSVFGNNPELGYELEVYGELYGCRTGIAKQTFPEGWSLDWALPKIGFHGEHKTGDKFSISLRELTNKLMEQIVVRIAGRELDPSGSGNFEVAFSYSLKEFNKDAGYGGGVEFL